MLCVFGVWYYKILSNWWFLRHIGIGGHVHGTIVNLFSPLHSSGLKSKGVSETYSTQARLDIPKSLDNLPTRGALEGRQSGQFRNDSKPILNTGSESCTYVGRAYWT